MTSMAQLRFLAAAPVLIPRQSYPFSPLGTLRLSSTPSLSFSLSGGGGSGIGGRGRGGGGRDDENGRWGPPAALLSGWRSRVEADPEFPFKVLMEEVVGVTACVLGDMASRPNFGMDELDFVFSTMVVGCIVNFVLMYLLAPTAAAGPAAALPWLFAGCPAGHMFEPGRFALVHRLGTCVYKGAVFSAVGFAAGLAGTALSNGLVRLRKRVDPGFRPPNRPPPPLLNAATWAAHMGVSSNLRYQTLNGVEFFMAGGVFPPPLFKAAVVLLRCVNNVLGGMTFVTLARLTGSQAGGSTGKVGGSSTEDSDRSGPEEVN